MTRRMLGTLILTLTAVLPAGVEVGASATTTDGYINPNFTVGSGFWASSPPTAPLVFTAQPDGKILVGGFFEKYNEFPMSGLGRINSDGSADATFSVGTGVNGEVTSFNHLGNGQIIVTGNFTEYNGAPRNNIARINADGSLDASYNPGGGFNDETTTSVLLPDGDLLVAGQFGYYDGNPVNGMARLNPDASYDPSFGAPPEMLGTVLTMVAQSDGRIVIGGNFTEYNATSRNGIARIMSDGTLDPSFDPGSGFTGSFPTGEVHDIEPVGSDLLVGGAFTAFNGTPRGNLAQLNSDGSLATIMAPTGTGFDAQVNGVVTQPDGKIFALGNFSTFNGTTASSIARLLPDGQLDPSFNSGIGFLGGANSAVLQSDGGLVVGGFFGEYQGVSANGIIGLIGYTVPVVPTLPQTQSNSGIPNRLRNPGRTLLNRRNATTEQGQPVTATLKVHPQSAPTTRGDVRCSKVKRGPGRKLAIRLTGQCRLKVTVTYAAPGSSEYFAYRQVVKYRTRNVK